MELNAIRKVCVQALDDFYVLSAEEEPAAAAVAESGPSRDAQEQDDERAPARKLRRFED